MRAALYTRVSTDEQTEGYSLDGQLSRLHAYCDSQGWTVADIYVDDGYSAKNIERPQMRRMLEDMKQRNFDIVLVLKLDRLTRSVLDLYRLLNEFEKYSVKFRSATEIYDTSSAVGRLFLTLVAALAQWERETIAERTKLGQVEMTKQGKWSGGRAAFGYDYVDGNLVINQEQATIVREIFKRYTDGLGTRQILGWLNDPDDPKPAPNRRWTLHALKYLLSNPLYVGLVRYGYRDIHGKRKGNAIIEEGQHEAIIDREIFEVATGEKQKRAKMPGRSGTGTFVFSGILYCAECGASMAGRIHYKANKATSPPRRAYVCSERMHSGICKMPQRSETFIESQILDKLSGYYDNLAKQLQEMQSGQQDTSEVEQRIRASLRRLDSADEVVRAALRNGDYTLEEFSAERAIIREERERLNNQLSMIGEGNQSEAADVAMTLLKDIRENWDSADVLGRKRMARSLIQRVKIDKEGNVDVTYR